MLFAVNFNLGGLLGGLNRQNQNKNNNNQRLDLAGIGLGILGNARKPLAHESGQKYIARDTDGVIPRITHEREFTSPTNTLSALYTVLQMYEQAKVHNGRGT